MFSSWCCCATEKSSVPPAQIQIDSDEVVMGGDTVVSSIECSPTSQVSVRLSRTVPSSESITKTIDGGTTAYSVSASSSAQYGMDLDMTGHDQLGHALLLSPVTQRALTETLEHPRTNSLDQRLPHPPSLGDACYLTWSPDQGGTLKLFYAKQTEHVKEPILGAAIFKRPQPAFKYKRPQVIAQGLQEDAKALYHALADFVRVAIRGQCVTYVFPSSAELPPFAIVYHIAGQLKFQRDNTDRVELQECRAAIIGNPEVLNRLTAADTLQYSALRSLLGGHADTCCFLDFSHR